MRKMLCAAALVAALPLGAQMPGRGPAVTFLLSHTGQLQLTDQQVVKLAAIARRAADRHKAMRASFDSLHMQFRGHGDSGMRQLRPAMEKERDANHADLRDALAVLTPDQQASAWELVSSHGHPRMLMRHMGPHRDGGGMHMRTGMMPDEGEDEALGESSPDDDQ